MPGSAMPAWRLPVCPSHSRLLTPGRPLRWPCTLPPFLKPPTNGGTMRCMGMQQDGAPLPPHVSDPQPSALTDAPAASVSEEISATPDEAKPVDSSSVPSQAPPQSDLELPVGFPWGEEPASPATAAVLGEDTVVALPPEPPAATAASVSTMTTDLTAFVETTDAAAAASMLVGAAAAAAAAVAAASVATEGSVSVSSAETRSGSAAASATAAGADLDDSNGSTNAVDNTTTTADNISDADADADAALSSDCEEEARALPAEFFAAIGNKGRSGSVAVALSSLAHASTVAAEAEAALEVALAAAAAESVATEAAGAASAAAAEAAATAMAALEAAAAEAAALEAAAAATFSPTAIDEYAAELSGSVGTVVTVTTDDGDDDGGGFSIPHPPRGRLEIIQPTVQLQLPPPPPSEEDMPPVGVSGEGASAKLAAAVEEEVPAVVSAPVAQRSPAANNTADAAAASASDLDYSSDEETPVVAAPAPASVIEHEEAATSAPTAAADGAADMGEASSIDKGEASRVNEASTTTATTVAAAAYEEMAARMHSTWPTASAGSAGATGGTSGRLQGAWASNLDDDSMEPKVDTRSRPNPSEDNGSHDPATINGFQLQSFHFLIVALLLIGGALFASMTLQFTEGVDFITAAVMVWKQVAKSVAFRQVVVISVAMLMVRFVLDSLLALLASLSKNPTPWNKTKAYYILREVYQPLEVLLFIAALCTMADSFLPSLMGISKIVVTKVVRAVLSTSFILVSAGVVFNIKARFCQENAWQAEMKGDTTEQRRWEAYDKLGSFVIYAISFVLGIQALGLEVTSVLAIGGIGGLAIGLAGREICENLFNGFLLMSTNPFNVGDEVLFFYSGKMIEGIVIDIGWYRTLIRSFEREVYVVPNAVFSKNIVLNVTRKNKEWRICENILVRHQDVQRVNGILQDIRRIVRNDTRVMGNLHRRVYLDKVDSISCKIYMSFYVEASNQDSYMAMKHELLLAFVDCVFRNGAKLAGPRNTVNMQADLVETFRKFDPMMAGFAVGQTMARGQPLGPSLSMADPRIINLDSR